MSINLCHRLSSAPSLERSQPDLGSLLRSESTSAPGNCFPSWSASSSLDLKGKSLPAAYEEAALLRTQARLLVCWRLCCFQSAVPLGGQGLPLSCPPSVCGVHLPWCCPHLKFWVFYCFASQKVCAIERKSSCKRRIGLHSISQNKKAQLNSQQSTCLIAELWFFIMSTLEPS